MENKSPHFKKKKGLILHYIDWDWYINTVVIQQYEKNLYVFKGLRKDSEKPAAAAQVRAAHGAAQRTAQPRPAGPGHMARAAGSQRHEVQGDL